MSLLRRVHHNERDVGTLAAYNHGEVLHPKTNLIHARAADEGFPRAAVIVGDGEWARNGRVPQSVARYIASADVDDRNCSNFAHVFGDPGYEARNIVLMGPRRHVRPELDRTDLQLLCVNRNSTVHFGGARSVFLYYYYWGSCRSWHRSI